MLPFEGDRMFSFASFFIGTVFVIVLSTIAFTVIRGIVRWNRNNLSPLLIENAKVISKRSQIWGGGHNTRASTTYYSTFELENGERVELPISGSNFGLLAEGDQGELTYQGTRYKGFQRKIG